MPTTTEVMNTSVMTLEIAGTVIGDCVDASLSFSHSARDISNKQDNGWRMLAPGQRSFSFSASAMYIPDHADYDFNDVFDLLDNRTKALARITSTAISDQWFEGNTYLASGNLNSNGVEDNVLYDVQLDGTGALSTGSVTA